MSTSTDHTETDSRWVNRVEALLAKASSTDFPDEAEALVAKAQQLMARHAIDEAMLAAAGRTKEAEVLVESLVIKAPYASAKSSLLAAVAYANSCRVVMQSGPDGTRHCSMVGHDHDLAATKTLFAALSVHAVRSMLVAPVPPYDTPRRFRHAFLLAFASRIGQRLTEAQKAAEQEAHQERGTGVSLVLTKRSAEVDRAFKAAFPHTRTARASHSSAAGSMSGRRAANNASLGGRPLPGRRRRLGSG